MTEQNSSFTDWMYASYEKIPESFSKWNLSESDYRAFKKTDWVVTEKIHGANFGIMTDGVDVQFAKRKEFLQPNEDFFGHQALEAKLVKQGQEIFKILQAESHSPLRISVYGELFGGEYPHSEVPAEPNVQAIQTGIYYSPTIEYCAFDIAVEENSNPVKRNYIDYDKALKIFDLVGMICAKPLFVGKYEEAIAYNIEFESTIPALLRLPKLTSNKAEGVVIKPLKSFYINTAKGRIRPILKRKISEFAEDSRFHQAVKWTDKPATTYQADNVDWLSQAMLALVTQTRLLNVISKVGRVSAKDGKTKQRITQLLVDDVLETFNEDYESVFSSLSAKSQQATLEQLNLKARNLVENYLSK